MSIKKIAFLASFALAVGLFFGGPSTKAVEAAEQTKTNKKPAKVVVEVQPGDSLSKIANKKKTTYQRIFYANKSIADPDIIHPGDKLRIPSKSEKLKERTIPSNQAPKQQTRVQSTSSSSQQSYQAPAATPTPAPAPAVSSSAVSGSVWDRLASCESGGNWSINTGNGYYGGVQFSAATWRAVGGTGLPHQHSKAEQIKRAQILQARSGWGQWPACSSMLGLR